MKIIADSGSTKTAWWIGESHGSLIHTQGINPYQQEPATILAIITDGLLPHIPSLSHIDEIWFYGAGCTPELSLSSSRLSVPHRPYSLAATCWGQREASASTPLA